MAEQIYIDLTGTIIPDTADTLATVEGEFKDALGQEMLTDPATPQGRLIAVEVNARDNMLRNNAAVANQINPNLAGGVFLDAIWALTGGARYPAERSVLPDVILGGIPGTIVPAGSQVSAGEPLFETLLDATLDASGLAITDMRAIEYGPIAALAGPLTLVSGILGWETAAAPVDATLGRLRESDVSARARRNRTLALQGDALPEAIMSRVAAVEGVRSLTFRENVGESTATIDGATLVAKSIYVVVDGGTDLDVATAILAAKSGGANYNGATVVNVVEPSSGQSYAVRFDRPELIAIKVRATVRVQGALGDPAAIVRAALMSYAAGEIDGETGFVVGQSASPFEMSGAVNRQAPAVYVQKMEIATLAGSLAVAEIPIGIAQQITLNINNIEVVVL